MISQLVRASTLAVVCVAALATESPARTPFDGAWSVLIVTTKGDCDRAYRYGVTIDYLGGNQNEAPYVKPWTESLRAALDLFLGAIA